MVQQPLTHHFILPSLPSVFSNAAQAGLEPINPMCISSPPTGPLHFATCPPQPNQGQPLVHFEVSYRQANKPNPTKRRVAANILRPGPIHSTRGHSSRVTGPHHTTHTPTLSSAVPGGSPPSVRWRATASRAPRSSAQPAAHASPKSLRHSPMHSLCRRVGHHTHPTRSPGRACLPGLG
eukprot:scaffold16728_cov137-Isochrysis_galbana.AAC.4